MTQQEFENKGNRKTVKFIDDVLKIMLNTKPKKIKKYNFHPTYKALKDFDSYEEEFQLNEKIHRKRLLGRYCRNKSG